MTTNYVSGVPQTPVTEITAYLIGDDVLAQTKNDDTQYLLYDGHGSTRQLAEYDTDVTIVGSFSYDGYGVLLQDNSVASANPSKVAPQTTNLLYTGEQWDVSAQHYYLRARWYNPNNGLFNQMDDFSGHQEDPISLHKYLYCQNNPINLIDPSGFDWIYANVGIEAHDEIAKIYKNEHSSHVVSANYYRIKGSVYKPDIMDYALKEIAEIKPLNFLEMAGGAAKLILYLETANSLGIAGIPPNPKKWTPSEWPVGLRVIPLPKHPGWSAVTLANIEGLVVYKTFKMPSDKLQSLLVGGLSVKLLSELNGLRSRLQDMKAAYNDIPGLVHAMDSKMNMIFSLNTAQQRAIQTSSYTLAGIMTYVAISTSISILRGV